MSDDSRHLRTFYNYYDMSVHWNELTQIDLRALGEQKSVFHEALQLVNIPGLYLGTPTTNYLNAGLKWNRPFMGLMSKPLSLGHQTIHTVLRLPTFELVILKDEKTILGEHDLRDKRYDIVLQWFQGVFERIGFNAENFSQPTSEIFMEKYFSQGAVSIHNFIAALEIVKLFNNAVLALRTLRIQLTGSSAITCWPTSFKLSTVVPLNISQNGEIRSGFEAGFCLGNQYIPEPYFFVNSLPSSGNDELTLCDMMGGGQGCCSDDVFGTKLLYTKLINQTDQYSMVNHFFYHNIRFLQENMKVLSHSNDKIRWN